MRAPPIRQLVLATGNPGKRVEVEALLGPLGITVQGPGEDWDPPEETEPDYAGNARLKAESLAGLRGLPSLADDSGLEVDALGGRPGVLSARYAPDSPARIEKMLGELDGVAAEDRTARFRCVLALLVPGEELRTFEGVLEGRIALAPRGEGGFGFDPIFELGDGRTLAQLDRAEKNGLSHRGLALRALVADLETRVC